VVVGAVLVAALAAASWYYSDEIIRPEPHRPLESGLRLTRLDDSTITLSGTDIGRRGRAWFLEWPGGYGTAGEMVAMDSVHVTRRFRLLGGRWSDGTPADLGAYPFGGDPRALDIPFQVVQVPAPSGACPAWLVPGSREIWVVLVHGMGAGRGEPLRAMPAVASL